MSKKFERIAHRYLHDARFHVMVSRFRHFLASRQGSPRDLRDAVRLAIVMEGNSTVTSAIEDLDSRCPTCGSPHRWLHRQIPEAYQPGGATCIDDWHSAAVVRSRIEVFK
ncbi:MAG TPA: hypothetical protein VN803_04050 [Gemmatimonadales bacterium]|nr:hypothetical protein [Gemmatimonadales bacterium]